MISKLAVWGSTRAEAIDRIRRALDEYAVGGIKTTLPFFREIVRDEEFIAGHLDTGFISRFNERRQARTLERGHPARTGGDARTQQDIAIIAAALAYARAQRQPSGAFQPAEKSKWKLAARAAGLNREPRRRPFERR